MLSTLAFSLSQQVALHTMHHKFAAHVKWTGFDMSSALVTSGACTDDIADQIVYAATRYVTINFFKLLQSACQCPSPTAEASSLYLSRACRIFDTSIVYAMAYVRCNHTALKGGSGHLLIAASCLCRPANVQIADIISYATYQASGTNIARVLAQQSGSQNA